MVDPSDARRSDGFMAALARRDLPPQAPILSDGSLGYGALEHLVEKTTGALAELGIEPGRRVAVIVDKSPAAFALILGLLGAGVVAMPLARGLPQDDLRDLLARAAPGLIIHDPAQAVPPLSGVQYRTLNAQGEGSWTDSLNAATPRPAPVLDSTAPAILLFTSGTTGPAKGAVLHHGNLCFAAQALSQIWGLSGSDRLLHALPFFHAHGLLIAVLPLLWVGATIDFRPRFDPSDVLRRLPDATCFMGVPFHYAQLLTHKGLTADATNAVRLWVSGSAPMPDTLRTGFEARVRRPVLERYGMTEGLIITANGSGSDGKPGTVGRALSGVTLRIVDPDNGQPMPPDQEGMVQFRGGNLFEGYLDDPNAQSAAMTADGFLITGDIGRLDAAGFLTLCGRKKDIILYCGMNIHPLEVERVLRACPEVADVAVFGVPHPLTGETVNAAIVAHPGATPDPTALRRSLVGKLAENKLPKRIIVVDDLPRNRLGKVMRDVLTRRFSPPGDLANGPESGQVQSSRSTMTGSSDGT